VQPGGPLSAAIYRHAIATGFSRGFLVAAGIALLTLAINLTVIRVRRADLASSDQPTLAVALEPE
jgi:threonine/homoserine/homoserine lactone efflux protein